MTPDTGPAGGAPPVGTRLSRDLLLDAAAIGAGASLARDRNPLHHDAAFAATTRFGGLIASGAHTSALLAGLISDLLTEGGYGPAVGVEYRVRFRRPVHVDRRMRMEWVVTGSEPGPSGDLVRLSGSIVDAQDGQVALSGEMTCLFFRHPAPSQPKDRP
jgi:3-hydroxybutyryl-CoA dehydratase